jgi:hypothetical protein
VITPLSAHRCFTPFRAVLQGPVSARRSLVKVQQPAGGSTKITLGARLCPATSLTASTHDERLDSVVTGTDRVTYVESSKEEALKSARSQALADVRHVVLVAARRLDGMFCCHRRPGNKWLLAWFSVKSPVVFLVEFRRPPPFHSVRDSLPVALGPPTLKSTLSRCSGESRELLEVTSATHRELEAAVTPEGREAVAKAPFAGTRPSHRESIKVEAPPGGPSHYKFGTFFCVAADASVEGVTLCSLRRVP